MMTFCIAFYESYLSTGERKGAGKSREKQADFEDQRPEVKIATCKTEHRKKRGEK
jgi:hypothetical protein